MLSQFSWYRGLRGGRWFLVQSHVMGYQDMHQWVRQEPTNWQRAEDWGDGTLRELLDNLLGGWSLYRRHRGGNWHLGFFRSWNTGMGSGYMWVRESRIRSLADFRTHISESY